MVERESAWYDYYSQVTNDSSTSKGSKWETRLSDISSDLEKVDVAFEGKTVLDISGGPGYFVKELSGIAKRAVVTEYSQTAADGMSKNLGIEAVKYDYNKDDIKELFEDKFDIIIISSIGFCSDIKSVAKSLKHITAPGAIIHILSGPPALSRCLLYQFDDYTFPAIYHAETIRRILAEEGFSFIYGECKNSKKHYLFSPAPPNWKYKLAAAPFCYLLGFWVRLTNKNINRELWLKTHLHIYQNTE